MGYLRIRVRRDHGLHLDGFLYNEDNRMQGRGNGKHVAKFRGNDLLGTMNRLPKLKGAIIVMVTNG